LLSSGHPVQVTQFNRAAFGRRVLRRAALDTEMRWLGDILGGWGYRLHGDGEGKQGGRPQRDGIEVVAGSDGDGGLEAPGRSVVSA
jgi:hypothetical protein